MLRLACFILVFAASTHAGAKSADKLSQPSANEARVAAKASEPCAIAMQSKGLNNNAIAKSDTWERRISNTTEKVVEGKRAGQSR